MIALDLLVKMPTQWLPVSTCAIANMARVFYGSQLKLGIIEALGKSAGKVRRISDCSFNLHCFPVYSRSNFGNSTPLLGIQNKDEERLDIRLWQPHLASGFPVWMLNGGPHWRIRTRLLSRQRQTPRHARKSEYNLTLSKLMQKFGRIPNFTRKSSGQPRCCLWIDSFCLFAVGPRGYTGWEGRCECEFDIKQNKMRRSIRFESIESKLPNQICCPLDPMTTYWRFTLYGVIPVRCMGPRLPGDVECRQHSTSQLPTGVSGHKRVERGRVCHPHYDLLSQV